MCKGVKHKEYKFIGVISLCNLNEKYFLIDGQHRFNVMYYLYNRYKHNFNVNVQIINVESMEDIKEVFDNINKNTPLPDMNFENSFEKDIISDTVLYFQSKYPLIWSEYSKCHRPSIFINYFEETILFIQKHIKSKNYEILIEIIEDYNDKHKNYVIEDYRDRSLTENMLNQAKKSEFYLGLYKYDNNQDYGYIWAKKIIEYKTSITISVKKKNRKTKITKPLRYLVWNTYIGTETRNTKCVLCDNIEIKIENFECGHIIAESKNGETILENLLPICGLCNKLMCNQNMDDFVTKNYTNNIEKYNKFKNKELTNII